MVNVSVAEAGSNLAPSRPYAFPKIRQTQRSGETRDGSHRTEHRADAAASSLTREADLPGEQPSDREAAAGRLDATPLLPNPFAASPAASVDVPNDTFRLVPLVDILIGPRLRGVVAEFTQLMLDSLSRYDIIQPPVVRRDPLHSDKFVLVSGLQRVNAARVSGADHILCRIAELTDIKAELWEIDENLVRTALSPAELALFIERRREIHEQIHGTGKARGAAAANAAMGRKTDASAILADASFTAETAKKSGMSARTVQRVVQRAAKNGQTNLKRIAGTSLDVPSELDALPRLPRATQDRLINEATAGAQVSAVQALRQMRELSVAMENLPAAAASQQAPSISTNQDGLQGLSALKRAWLDASDSVRKKFLVWIKDIGQV